MMPDIGDTLGRKIGPLPVWAWGGVVGGGFLVVRAMSGGGGASSPFVQPIATPDGMNFEPGAGGGGGDAHEPWWAQIPGVGTIIDRPPGDVTIIPSPGSGGGGGSGPTTPSTQRFVLTLKSTTNLFSNPLKPHDAKGASGSYIVQRVTIGGKQWWKIVGTKSGASSPRIGMYIPFYSNPSTYAVAQGDTYPEGGGDSTPATPLAMVPAVPPIPLGSGIGALYPRFDRPPTNGGIVIDTATPIASAARIAMPPFNGGTTGNVAVPAVPYPSARAGRFDPARFGDTIARTVGGWRSRGVPPPTVVRLPTNPLGRHVAGWRASIASRRAPSG